MEHNLKLLGLVIVVAAMAFVALSYLNKSGEEYDVSPVIVQTKPKNTTEVKRLTAFKTYQGTKQKKETILERVSDQSPLSAQEKKVILDQFSKKNTTPIPLTNAERMKINNALNQ